ncbi:TolC family protein [Reichenbachiella ulvae]|uniref:TolC family protein n=1 Tax=Reichenbachiella ulvae TaxID=2980104 RepID=A0ABT3CVK0_9BACT|nr:TolC family protein [Reichenbachiella ulvae]MCV9387268.1 TolC family protein [Reichenbachiella ulvae]
MKQSLGFLLFILVLCRSLPSLGQTTSLTLDECIEYALENQPALEQSLIDQQIGRHEINASLAEWLPQISANYALNHNIERQSMVIGDQTIRMGQNYNSNIELRADQTLYSNEAFLASRASRNTRLRLEQDVASTKINTVVDVSKAFYDILLTREQLNILDENIVRQQKQYNDAFAQYENGIVDKTDYQRASITLANTRSSRNRTQESLKAKFAYLKQLIGFPLEEEFDLNYNSQQVLEREIQLDTTQDLQIESRIEYRQLTTDRELLKLNTNYYQMGLIPRVSAYVNYNPQYFNNNFGDLYGTAYPTSSVGLTASIPIFTGNKRIQQIKIAKLQESRLDVTIEDTKRAINTEYQTALASYKSDYLDMTTLRSNADLAQQVYNTIKLQYDEGIKSYLEVIVAETELQTAQLNYLNAVFQLLSSKLDFQKAIGTIEIN